MKAIVPVTLCTVFAVSCSTQKEIQADLVNVELVKIEVVQRFPDHAKKMLTWRDAKHVDYITYESVHSDYQLGAVMKMILRK